MKKILPALSLALATSGAQADPVDEMPYMKAWAYALAIEDYCFGDKPDNACAACATQLLDRLLSQIWICARLMMLPRSIS